MDLTNKAIEAALKRDWKEAVKLNLQILKSHPQDVDALNRLGKAYLQSGLKTKAELTYKKALKVDKFNPIAQKALDSIKTFKVDHIHNSPSTPLDFTSAFLEEPGTTKTISITRLGDIKVLSHLQPGDEVYLAAREHCVMVVNRQNEHIGRLPDDLASRMGIFLKAGNTYQVWIKSTEIHGGPSKQPGVKIFIRELTRANKFRHTPSFPATEKLSYAAFTPPELIHTEKPDISTPEEDVEEFGTGGGDKTDSGDSDSEPPSLGSPDDD